MTVGDIIYIFRVSPAIPDGLVCYCDTPDHGPLTPEDWISEKWKMAIKPEFGELQDREVSTIEDAFSLITESVFESDEIVPNMLRKDFVDMIPGDATITPCGLDAVAGSLQEIVPLMCGTQKIEFQIEEEPNV